MGNRAGDDALICELVGSELARLMGLSTPDFAVAHIPSLSLPTHPGTVIESGPAFFSKWEESTALSPNSSLLQKIRHPNHIAKLVVLDTWIRNGDRFSSSGGVGKVSMNFENVLLRKDKRLVELLVIDHSHAIVETTLDDELDEEWVNEEVVYGMFRQFEPFVTRKHLLDALQTLEQVDAEAIQGVCASIPIEWGATHNLCQKLADCLIRRGKRLCEWLPQTIFGQYELDL